MHPALHILAVIRDGAEPDATAKLQAEVDAEWASFDAASRTDWNRAWRSKHTRDCDLSGYEDEYCDCDPPDAIGEPSDVQQAHRDRQRVNAHRQSIEYVLARLDDGRWTEPSLYMNLVGGRRAAIVRYDEIRELGAPRRVLDLFTRWIAQADEMLNAGRGDAFAVRIRSYGSVTPKSYGIFRVD